MQLVNLLLSFERLWVLVCAVRQVASCDYGFIGKLQDKKFFGFRDSDTR